MTPPIYVGTAGWSIPSEFKSLFPMHGSHLERYASVFNAVEINSSFYREHKYQTYAKWASMVPDHFRFSAKLNRYFTQEKKMHEHGQHLKEILNGMSGLGEKWAVLLVQLPPSLDFDWRVTEEFLKDLKEYCHRPIVWEPRHPSWGSKQALEMLAEFEISKVMADPERCPIRKSQRPPVEKFRYLRLHGTPIIYLSDYSARIPRIENAILHPPSKADQTLCIFDNSSHGVATKNSFELTQRLLALP